MTVIAVIAILWYVPVISVTGVVHLFVNHWRSYGTKSYFLLYAMGLLVFVATAFAMPYLLRVRVPIPFYLIPVGFVLLASGLAFLFWSYKALSFRHLAWYFELTQDAHSAGEPVQRGPYRFCRHPVYSAALVIMVSAFLVSGVASLAIPVIMILGLTVSEERELRTRFGEAYRDYSSQVPLLFGPKVRRGENQEGATQRVITAGLPKQP